MHIIETQSAELVFNCGHLEAAVYFLTHRYR